MSREVADTFDIAHLTICDVAAQALRNAKMDPFKLRDRNVGVYIGGTCGSPWAADLVYGTMIEQTAEYLHGLPEFKSPAFARQPSDFVARVAREVVDTVAARYVGERREGGPNFARTWPPASSATRLD